MTGRFVCTSEADVAGGDAAQVTSAATSTVGDSAQCQHARMRVKVWMSFQTMNTSIIIINHSRGSEDFAYRLWRPVGYIMLWITVCLIGVLQVFQCLSNHCSF